MNGRMKTNLLSLSLSLYKKFVKKSWIRTDRKIREAISIYFQGNFLNYTNTNTLLFTSNVKGKFGEELFLLFRIRGNKKKKEKSRK